MEKKRQLFFLIILSTAFFLLDLAGALKIVRTTADPMVVILKRNIYSIGLAGRHIGEVVFSYSNIRSIMDEVITLRQVNEELSHSVKILRDENDALRSQLGAPPLPSYKFVPAQVLSVSDTMDIAVGEKAGVRKGFSVVWGESLIGNVTDTTQFRSKVQIVSDPKSSIPARSSRGTQGVVIGQTGGTVLFSNVLQKDQLFLDDQVYTSGEGGFPPNLLIGKVSHIMKSDVAVYKQAVLALTANPHDMQTVFVTSAL